MMKAVPDRTAFICFGPPLVRRLGAFSDRTALKYDEPPLVRRFGLFSV